MLKLFTLMLFADLLAYLNTTHRPLTDPHPMPGRAPSKRGVGFSFGPDYTAAFLKQNNLQLLIRSHEMQVRTRIV